MAIECKPDHHVLEGQIANLQCQLDRTREQRERLASTISSLQSTNKRLKADKVKLVECLRVYGDQRKWYRNTFQPPIREGGHELAQQTLQDLGEKL